MGFVEAVAERLTVKAGALVLVSIWVLYLVVGRIDEIRRIRRLGAPEAAKIKTYLPFNLDFTYKALKAGRENRIAEFWHDQVSRLPAWTGRTRVMGVPVLFTADPENIKALLASQFSDYGKGAPFHRTWRAFLGDSIFTVDGRPWHDARQLLRPQFARDRVSDLHCFESHILTLFDVVRLEAGGDGIGGGRLPVRGGELELSDLLLRFTLDVTTDFLLGIDVKSLTTANTEFAQAFAEVQRVQAILARAGKLEPFVPRRSFNRALDVINTFVNGYIDEALRLPPEELAAKAGGDRGYTFLHALAAFTRDRGVLRDQILAVLIAGRDTTAATLSWALYELARHPAVVERLRHEVLAALGPQRAPTYADLKDMRFLRHVLSETLRLYPAVPFNLRMALRDTTLPRGGGPDGRDPIAVLKDSFVGYGALLMQRRDDLYPPSPPPPPPTSTSGGGGGGPEDQDPLPPSGEWAPERWERWQPRPWEYIPFNGGPRICIGQQFALVEMSYVLCRFFQRYERIESRMGPVDGGNPCLKADITLQPAQGVRVALWEADEF